MAYTPPNTFADGTLLTAAAVEGNSEALRVYLHDGITGGDLRNTQWIETRHVQPPTYDAIRGLQHGVTGHAGGQWAGGTNIRLQFATKYLSGNGRPGNDSFHAFPQTAISFDVRSPAFCLYHYWFELENGRDSSPDRGYQVPAAERRVYVIPYTGRFTQSNVFNSRARAQETRNVNDSLSNSYPLGLGRPFVLAAGYGAKQGTFMLDRTSPGVVTFGLAIHSLSDRCGLVNWGIAVEAYYF
jgi:hypothetical protein